MTTLRSLSIGAAAAALSFLAACGDAGTSSLKASSGGAAATAAGGGGATGGGTFWMPPTTPAAGGAPSGAAAGGAGGALVEPPPAPTTRPYDPDASIDFDWPESTRDGGAHACQAGKYAGTFECAFLYSTADGGALPPQPPGTPPGAPFQVLGPLAFELQTTQDGEFLEVTGGKLSGNAVVFIFFEGDLSGKLNCRTGEFVGNVSNGTLNFPPPPPPLTPGPPLGSFEGPAEATYSQTGPALVNGKWAFDAITPENKVLGTCTGTWTVTYAP